MAFLGKTFIAGTEFLDGKFKSGISFSTSRKSPISYTYETPNSNWQVEFQKNSTDVVARTPQVFSFEQLQSQGFEIIQSALDILSVKGVFSTNLENPARSNNGVYCTNGKSIAYVYSLLDLGMNMSVNMTQTDSSGNVINPPLPPEPVWNESFRYYRLSQSSTDLFEAYRNLFLAFEALLNHICPKNRREGEGAWLRRSLGIINSRVNLSQFTQTENEDPIDYIFNSQYRDIRCNLQHAKFPSATLPHSLLGPSEVKQAYSELVKIWRSIAGDYLNVPTAGGVVTYAGFEHMMANVSEQGVSLFYTSDNSPPQKQDTKISPNGKPAYECISTKYKGQTKPGVIRLVGYEDTSELEEQYINPIYRFCSKAESALIGVVYVEQGMIVSGVDGLEIIQEYRLINSSQPKTEFKT